MKAVARSAYRDIPPFDKAVELPDAIFIEYEWGFASVTALWRDWREQRRERRRARRLRRARRAVPRRS